MLIGAVMVKWWGYIHVDGSLHVKRFFDFGDILEAQASDFVKSVTAPFEADSRSESMEVYKRILKTLSGG